MSLVHQCAAPDCHVVTMGALCIDHEREALASSRDDAREQIINAAARGQVRDSRGAGPDSRKPSDPVGARFASFAAFRSNPSLNVVRRQLPPSTLVTALASAPRINPMHVDRPFAIGYFDAR